MDITRRAVRFAIKAMFDRLDTTNLFAAPFARRWEYADGEHRLMRNISAIVDSTHVFIAKPQDRVLRRLLWFNKGEKKGHAIIFNVFINPGREVIACSWWYPPKVWDTCESSRLKVGAIHLCIKLPIFVCFRPTTQTLREIWMLLFRGCGMGLALICALVTFIIGHVPTWLLGCRGHDRSPLCAKPDEVEAEVEVVGVEVKLSVVVAGAMVEDGLGNMHNKW